MNESTPVVGSGRAVTMAFMLTLADGTIVDEAGEREPLSFVFGDGTLSAGLESELLGLRPGDRREVILAPGQGFGPRTTDKIHTLARNEFPTKMELEVGSVVEFSMPNGESMAGTILDRNATWVAVDFNHPLADREVRFSVRILAIA